MTWEARRGYLVGMALVLGPVLLCLGLFAVLTLRVPERWEIPDSYRGWVVLTVEDPACPTPPRRGLARVIAFDRSGRACTPRAAMRGFRNVSYIYVAADGKRTTLRYEDETFAGVQAWRSATAGGSDYPHPFEVVFIGTQAEAERARSLDIFP